MSFQQIMTPVRTAKGLAPEPDQARIEASLLQTLLSEACMYLSPEQRAELAQFAEQISTRSQNNAH